MPEESTSVPEVKYQFLWVHIAYEGDVPFMIMNPYANAAQAEAHREHSAKYGRLFTNGRVERVRGIETPEEKRWKVFTGYDFKETDRFSEMVAQINEREDLRLRNESPRT